MSNIAEISERITELEKILARNPEYDWYRYLVLTAMYRHAGGKKPIGVNREEIRVIEFMIEQQRVYIKHSKDEISNLNKSRRQIVDMMRYVKKTNPGIEVPVITHLSAYNEVCMELAHEVYGDVAIKVYNNPIINEILMEEL